MPGMCAHSTHSGAAKPEDAARIVPRAEFRVFGHGIIDAVQSALWDCAAVLHKSRKMPPETYLLSVQSTEANVKVRDGLLDIKMKIGETSEGYDIFQPRARFPFPVSAADLATALSYLKVYIPLPKAAYSVEECVAMARRHPDMAIAIVEKMRYGFMVEGVLCEYAQVWFNGALMESACCESENYTGIQKVVQALGIAEMPNTNYIEAARRVVGMC